MARPTTARIFFLVSAVFLYVALLDFASAASSGRPRALVLPVVKDAVTKQYVATLQHKTPLESEKFVVDLGSPFLWADCASDYDSTTFRPVPCGNQACDAAGAVACTTECSGPARPGCNNNTCSGIPSNPFSRVSTSGDLSDDVLVLRSTDGRSAGRTAIVPHFVFMCAPSGLVTDLASGSRGILGLGRTGVAAPTQLATALRFKKKFAVCLPSSASSDPGVIFFGDSPYVLLPGVDVSESVAYTKLLINPVSTAGSYFSGQRSVEYFVKVTAIKVNGKVVPVNSTLLDIHKANGGTKISTAAAYTTLESSVYRAVEAAFVREAAARAIKRVAAVKPFGACFSTRNVGSTRVGVPVPEIELSFAGARAGWKIFGANSMVMVKEGVMCLGFVDGGKDTRTTVMIGGYQLENNLLQFDLENSKMGFSSSLLFRQTTCSNFNFTSSAM
ncbi:unnamed protein product [Victoria cruziana]